ncbi:hypothetical protein PF008_g6360 [Phytophthora fragariae]|uniref:Uncharacterized protein n=1 Tax=Phytophthora fragariae TaxID=53985 RepID=A0A6G0S7H0_9STRA|nr:hypothetical protein PF008_g6360 [Phytophthora fragariae]
MLLTIAAVYIMKAFYDVRKKCDAWLSDMDWIISTKRGKISAMPELFDKETESDELEPTTADKTHKAIADDVAKILGEACLGSLFRLSSGGLTGGVLCPGFIRSYCGM